MRLRIVVMTLLVCLIVTVPSIAQPGVVITAENADLLLLLRTITAESRVTAMAWAPDGTRIAYGTDDGTIWVVGIGTQNTTPILLEGHSEAVGSLAFAPNDPILYSGSFDGDLHVWDLRTGALLEVINADEPIFAIASNPSSDVLLVYAGESGDIEQVNWTVPPPDLILPAMTGHDEAVFDLEYSPDATLVASASADFTVRVWDPDTGSEVRIDDASHTDRVYDVAFTSDGETLASAGQDGAVWLRPSRQAGEPFRIMQIPESAAASAVDFSVQDDLLAVGSGDSNVYLMRVPTPENPTPEQVGLLIGHTDQITKVAFSPSGSVLATSSLDGTIKLWAMDTELLVTSAQVAPRVLCAGTPPSRVDIDLRAQVTFGDGRDLRVRETAAGPVLFSIAEGTAFDIIGGPQCAGAFTWWNVEFGDGRTGWLAEGDNNQYFIEPLPIITSQTLRETSGTAVIFGTVWHDVCDNDAVGGVPENCENGERGLEGDGLFTPDEPTIRDVTVLLGIGACPVDNILAQQVTGTDGRYEFDNLAAGRYCVSIDPLTPGNGEALSTGFWTLPKPMFDDGAAYYTVEVQPDELADARNFGWDYAFAP